MLAALRARLDLTPFHRDLRVAGAILPRHLVGPRSLPVADGLQHEVLSLPIGPHLPDDQIDYVVDRVRAFDG